MNAHRFLYYSLVSFWLVIASYVAWELLSQQWFPEEINQLGKAGTAYTLSFLLSLAILMWTTLHLCQQKPVARIGLLIGAAGLILSGYFTSYRIDYYAVSTLASVIYILLGIIVALAFSHEPPPLKNLYGSKPFHLPSCKSLVVIGAICIFSGYFSTYFVTEESIVVTNYLASIKRPIELLPLFFFILDVQIILIILLNFRLSFIRYLYVLSVLVVLGFDFFNISTTEGGCFAVLNNIFYFTTGILLVIIFSKPLSNFFDKPLKIYKINLPQKNQEILSKLESYTNYKNKNSEESTSFMDVFKESWQLVYGSKFLFLVTLLPAGIILLIKSYIGTYSQITEPCRILFTYGLYFFSSLLSILGLSKAFNIPLSIKAIYALYMSKFSRTLTLFVLICIASYAVQLTLNYFLIKTNSFVFIVFEWLITDIVSFSIFVFVLPLILMADCKVKQAIRITYFILCENGISIISCLLLMSLIIILSAIPLGLGLFWTIPMDFIMSGILFRNTLGLNLRNRIAEAEDSKTDFQYLHIGPASLIEKA